MFSAQPPILHAQTPLFLGQHFPFTFRGHCWRFKNNLQKPREQSEWRRPVSPHFLPVSSLVNAVKEPFNENMVGNRPRTRPRPGGMNELRLCPPRAHRPEAGKERAQKAGDRQTQTQLLPPSCVILSKCFTSLGLSLLTGNMR